MMIPSVLRLVIAIDDIKIREKLPLFVPRHVCSACRIWSYFSFEVSPFQSGTGPSYDGEKPFGH